MSTAAFRALSAEPKAPVTGPAAPHAVKGKPQFALGRLPQGVMNKTEERFHDEYIVPFVAIKEIVWWQFEGVKLRIAPNTFITIDFALMRKDGSFELVDVKGSKAMIEDDAWVKLKVARDRFPFRMFIAVPQKRGGWDFEEVGR